jgi:putative aldouronate transport system substrate-binding protein
MKKLLAMLLALAIAVSALAACTNEGGSGKEDGTTAATTKEAQESADTKEATADTEPADSGKRDINGLELPISDSGETLDVWLAYNGTLVKDINDIESVKVMEQNTGVHINWTIVSLSELNEKFSTLIASGDYPDIVFLSFFPEYPGGWAKGVEDGVVAKLNDYIQFMPNYKAVLEANEWGDKQAKSDDGEYLIFYSIQGTDTEIKGEGVVSGVAYRSDILEQLNLEAPTTIDELHDVLVKVKEAGICEYPFMPSQSGTSELSLSYGVRPFASMQVNKEGKIEFNATNPNFGVYMEEMRKWYAEGLIDPNFATFNFFMDLPASVEANSAFLYSTLTSANTGHGLYSTGKISNPDAYLQAYVAQAATDDGLAKMDELQVTKCPGFISTSCKNPELAAKWLDYLYTDEAAVLLWYGIQGETFEYDANGHPQYTDAVINNVDGLPGSDYIQKIALCNNYAACWVGKANNEAGVKLTATLGGGDDAQAQSVAIWSEPEYNIALPAGVSLTDEEGYIVNQFYTDIQTLTNEYVIKYITGVSDESFDSFVDKAYSYHLQEVIDCYQAAYERFVNR